MAERRGSSQTNRSRRSGSSGGRAAGYNQNYERGYEARGGRPANQMYDSWSDSRGRTLTGSNFLLALVGFLFIVCLSVVVTLNLRQLYYFEIKYQQLTYTTGLSEETIRENYDTLIDYNLLTKGVSKLEFPDFEMSEHGRIHFAEVKRIFLVIQVLCIVAGVIFLIGQFRKIRRRDYGSLKLTAILTLVLPVGLGALAALNWNSFFVKFHEIFFTNTYWIFDPVTDPVINILPDAFFLHCLAAILLFILLGCILVTLLYRALTRRRRR